MSSYAPDPYKRQRALWTGMRLYARWIIWWMHVGYMFGALKAPGRWARWLAYEMGRLEFGLRCLLIVGAQRMKADPSPAQPAPQHPTPNDTPTVKRRCGFSFSLKGFEVGEAPVGARKAGIRTKADQALVELDLFARLEALLAVFDHTDAFAQKMADVLARRGVKLRKRDTLRPHGMARACWSDPLGAAPVMAAPGLDSS